MKVLHIVQSSDTCIGGSLTVARALVKAQRDIGLEAWLVCLYDTPSRSKAEPARDFEIQCLISRKSRWTQGILALRRALIQLQPDLIHHHDGILWPRLATLGLGIPRITHGHLGAPTAGWLNGARLTHRLTLATTDRLIAISTWVAQSWESSGMPSEHIAIIPNGVDAERFYRRPEHERNDNRAKLGISLNEKLILWAGRLDRETKGLDRLVAIANWLPPNVRLVIAGDGPDKVWLKSTLSAAGIHAAHLLIGQVEDPAALFGSADAFLFTSKVEPFGLVLLEAACSSLPIFACECTGGGADLLVELNAFIAQDSNLDSLAQAISAEVPQPAMVALQALRDKYSWVAVAQSTARLYAGLIHREI